MEQSALAGAGAGANWTSSLGHLVPLVQLRSPAGTVPGAGASQLGPRRDEAPADALRFPWEPGPAAGAGGARRLREKYAALLLRASPPPWGAQPPAHPGARAGGGGGGDGAQARRSCRSSPRPYHNTRLPGRLFAQASELEGFLDRAQAAARQAQGQHRWQVVLQQLEQEAADCQVCGRQYNTQGSLRLALPPRPAALALFLAALAGWAPLTCARRLLPAALQAQLRDLAHASPRLQQHLAPDAANPAGAELGAGGGGDSRRGGAEVAEDAAVEAALQGLPEGLVPGAVSLATVVAELLAASRGRGVPLQADTVQGIQGHLAALRQVGGAAAFCYSTRLQLPVSWCHAFWGPGADA